ncbi:hypothetical protein ACFL4Q_04585 [candidate division KSB1 bacterium]
MKIKIRKSKISNKQYSSAVFPRVTREEASGTAKKEPAKEPLYKLERAPVIYNEDASLGFFGIKSLKEIIFRMQSEKEKFGECLNRMITVFSDIVVTDGGVMDEFSGSGAAFAFSSGSSPVKAIEKTLVTCLRMRYLLNKMNRQWGFHKMPWNISCGIDYGLVEFREIKEGTETYSALTGKPADTARGIGLSAGNSQILLTDSTIVKYPALDTKFDIKPAYHLPVHGQEHLCKIREVVGMVGPQAKKIFEDFV